MRNLFLPTGQNSIFKIKISLFSNCVIIAGRTINPLFVRSPISYAFIDFARFSPRSNNLVFSHSHMDFTFQDSFLNFFRKMGIIFNKIFSSLDFHMDAAIKKEQGDKENRYFLHNSIFTIKKRNCQDG